MDSSYALELLLDTCPSGSVAVLVLAVEAEDAALVVAPFHVHESVPGQAVHVAALSHEAVPSRVAAPGVVHAHEVVLAPVHAVVLLPVRVPANR